MRETAETHASLFAEHRALYGENVAVKLERCLRVTDAEYEAGLRTRERYRERFAELMQGRRRPARPRLFRWSPRRSGSATSRCGTD